MVAVAPSSMLLPFRAELEHDEFATDASGFREQDLGVDQLVAVAISPRLLLQVTDATFFGPGPGDSGFFLQLPLRFLLLLDLSNCLQ